jgi:hypothetical protein
VGVRHDGLKQSEAIASLAAVQAVTRVMLDHTRAYRTNRCSCGEAIPGDGDFNIHLLVMAYEKGRSDADV